MSCDLDLTAVASAYELVFLKVALRMLFLYAYLFLVCPGQLSHHPHVISLVDVFDGWLLLLGLAGFRRGVGRKVALEV